MIQLIKVIIFIEVPLLLALALFTRLLRPEFARQISQKIVITIATIPAIGMMSPHYLVFYAFLFVAPALLSRTRTELACIYLLMLTQFPELGLHLIVGSVYLFDFSAVLSFNAGALLALTLVRSERSNVPQTADFWVIALYVLLVISNARGQPPTGAARVAFTTFCGVVPPYFVLSRGIQTFDAARKVLLLFCLGIFCNVGVALPEVRTGWPLYQEMYSHFDVPLLLSATLSKRAGLLRAQGIVFNGASLSLMCAMALLAALAIRDGFTRLGRWIIPAAYVIGMIATQSRGGWIGAVAGLSFYWIYRRRTSYALGFLAVIGCGALVLSAASNTGFFGQLIGRSGDAKFTADYRRDLFSRGVQEVRAHPIMGQTPEQLEISMNDMRQGQHIIDFVNSHLTIALSTGLIGFAIWLAVWIAPLVYARRRRSRDPADPVTRLAAVPVGMLGALFAGLALVSLVDRLLPMVLVTIGMIYAFTRLRAPAAAPLEGLSVKDRSETGVGWRPGGRPRAPTIISRRAPRTVP